MWTVAGAESEQQDDRDVKLGRNATRRRLLLHPPVAAAFDVVLLVYWTSKRMFTLGQDVVGHASQGEYVTGINLEKKHLTCLETINTQKPGGYING